MYQRTVNELPQMSNCYRVKSMTQCDLHVPHEMNKSREPEIKGNPGIVVNMYRAPLKNLLNNKSVEMKMGRGGHVFR